MKRLILAALLLSAPAVAQSQPEPPPEVITLSQMLRDAQQREIAAVYRAVVAERKLAALEAKPEVTKP